MDSCTFRMGKTKRKTKKQKEQDNKSTTLPTTDLNILRRVLREIHKDNIIKDADQTSDVVPDIQPKKIARIEGTNTNSCKCKIYSNTLESLKKPMNESISEDINDRKEDIYLIRALVWLKSAILSMKEVPIEHFHIAFSKLWIFSEESANCTKNKDSRLSIEKNCIDQSYSPNNNIEKLNNEEDEFEEFVSTIDELFTPAVKNTDEEELKLTNLLDRNDSNQCNEFSDVADINIFHSTSSGSHNSILAVDNNSWAEYIVNDLESDTSGISYGRLLSQFSDFSEDSGNLEDYRLQDREYAFSSEDTTFTMTRSYLVETDIMPNTQETKSSLVSNVSLCYQKNEENDLRCSNENVSISSHLSQIITPVESNTHTGSVYFNRQDISKSLDCLITDDSLPCMNNEKESGYDTLTCVCANCTCIKDEDLQEQTQRNCLDTYSEYNAMDTRNIINSISIDNYKAEIGDNFAILIDKNSDREVHARKRKLYDSLNDSLRSVIEEEELSLPSLSFGGSGRSTREETAASNQTVSEEKTQLSLAKLNSVLNSSNANEIVFTPIKDILSLFEEGKIVKAYIKRKCWRDTLEEEVVKMIIDFSDIYDTETNTENCSKFIVEMLTRSFEKILNVSDMSKITLSINHTPILLEFLQSKEVCIKVINFLCTKLDEYIADFASVPVEDAETKLKLLHKLQVLLHILEIGLRKYRLGCSDREDSPERIVIVTELWKECNNKIEDVSNRESGRSRERRWMNTLEKVSVVSSDDFIELTGKSRKLMRILLQT